MEIERNVGRFANESFRKPSVRKRVGSIRKRPIVVSQTSNLEGPIYTIRFCCMRQAHNRPTT